MVTQEYHVEGPVMLFLTTTAIDIDEELLNRCLVLTIDESREQTARDPAAASASSARWQGCWPDARRKRLTVLHRNAQRLLKPLAVVNPYADQLTFLDEAHAHPARSREVSDPDRRHCLAAPASARGEQDRVPGTSQPAQVPSTISKWSRPTSRSPTGWRMKCWAAASTSCRRRRGRCWAASAPWWRRGCKAQGLAALRCALHPARTARADRAWATRKLGCIMERLMEMEYVLAHRGGRGTSFVYELFLTARRTMPGPVCPA